ncbi:protein disulfide-isomerase a6 [Holotrichia oblita]|uniref:Protein disulfide-isomerase a6 n=1 Tax=Holotrichia oblita TaxID=644536 RepID=A0ACB9TV95_HOLOL|nr:protein disulfide-isomerase a6 [Holotrichia oblita]
MENLRQIGQLSLTGDPAENFKRWRQRFEIYVEASGIGTGTDITEERKVAILLYIIGGDTLEIYNTLDLTEEEKKDYIKVLDKLQLYFVTKSNESKTSVQYSITK